MIPFNARSGISQGSEVHDVAVVDVKAWPTVIIGRGRVHIEIVVQNKGTSYESFDLTIYVNNHTIESMTVANLEPGTNKSLEFVWEYHPFKLFQSQWRVDKPMIENFTIWAEASTVADEIDISNNIYTNCIITMIWWVPDADGDGRISVYDVYIVARAFLSSPEGPRWNPCVDFNQDGKINILDVYILAKSFGRTYGLAEAEGK